jgi:hypothetical protein
VPPGVTAALGLPAGRRPIVELGRPFVHHGFDYLVIGGGMSLAFAAWLKLGGAARVSALLAGQLWLLVLASNSAHFAASTVRLYSKRGTFDSLRFLTMGLPLATLVALLLALALPQQLGRHLMALYFTWSPYHYAAQTYGLAVMYCYRSGFDPGPANKRWLRLVCLLPFIYAFLGAKVAGIEWLVPARVLELPAVDLLRARSLSVAGALSFAAPVALFARCQSGAGRMPLISLVTMLANAVWWVALTYMDAFVWATIFHGLQYLAIVTIFQVKEDMAREGGAPRWWRHAARFYATCLVLGYLLFQAWPHAFVLVGFSYAESLLLVVAVVNIHHFVVDAYIWRLRRDPNYAVVKAGAAV